MIRVLPAIDIIEGQCVRLTKGDYDTKKVYGDDPLEMAKQFEGCGVEQIHVVDLDGAKQKQPQNLNQIERIKTHTQLKVEFGGGIKTEEALADCNNAGVDQFIIGSLAVKDKDLVSSWLSKFGADRFVLGADVQDGFIAINGWQEKSDMSLEAFISDYHELGAHYFLCTDINKDGMLQGSSKDLYENLIHKFPNIKLIASGGVTSLDEVKELDEMGCDGAIIGKAIYEGRIKLSELKDFVGRSL